jgi:hypothetical protein
MTYRLTPSNQPIHAWLPKSRPDPSLAADECRLEALTRLRGAGRRQRQQVEILSAIVEERMTRALGLAFELVRFTPSSNRPPNPELYPYREALPYSGTCARGRLGRHPRPTSTGSGRSPRMGDRRRGDRFATGANR